MSSTINHSGSSGEGRPLAQVIQEIAAGRRSAADVARLSDPDRAATRQIEALWLQLPLDARRFVVRQMVELEESNIELNFARILRIAMRDPDPDVRALAIGGLWEDESLMFLDPLLEAVESEDDPLVREAIAQALGRFSYRASLGDLDEAHADRVRQALRRLFEGDERPNVRRRALESLAYFSDDVEVEEWIAEAYHSGEHGMRVSAVYAMGRHLGSRWFPTLLEELHSDDPELRYEAAKASGEYGDRRAVEPLVSLLDDEDREVQFAAIGALGQIGGRVAIRELRRLTREGDAAVQDAAEEALLEAIQIDDPLRPNL